MRNRLKKDYQLDVGRRMICPAAMFAACGNGILPPKAPRCDEGIYGGLGEYRQRSQNVINSLEEIIIGSEWEKLDAIANTLELVRFLHEQGLYIFSATFLPETDDAGNYWWILQIRIHDEKSKDHKHPCPLTPDQKEKIKSLVLQGLEKRGVKESDIEIFE